MTTRNWILGILFLVVISSSLFLRRSWTDRHSERAQAGKIQVGANSLTAEDSAGGEKSKKRDSSSSPHANGDTINQLESIAKTSPGLIDRLSLLLFDNNLEPNADEWKLLGANADEVNKLSQDLKGIFGTLKSEEARNFGVINQSDKLVQLSIPKLSAEEASQRVAQIQDSYSRIFGPELAQAMTRQFINSHLAIAGGLDGRDRVVSITPTSEETYAQTGRKYEIKTQVMYQGTKLSDAMSNLDNYSQNTGLEIVEKIPDNWSHLFGKSE